MNAMQLNVELFTPKGIIQCTLTRTQLYGMEVVCADMWQSAQVNNMEAFTTFRAVVHMRWEVDRYRIVERQYRDVNEFWTQMERVISDTIVVNE